MRAVWRITTKDLLLRLRDRSALVIGILTPLALAFIFNAVFGNAFGEGSITTLGFADEDGGEIAAGLGETLEELNREQVIAYVAESDRAALVAAVDDGEYQAGIVVPQGFSESVIEGREGRLEVIGAVDAPTVTSIAQSLAETYARRVRNGQVAVETYLSGALGPVDPGRVPEVVEAATAAPPLLSVVRLDAADRVVEPSTFFSAGMAAFFLFFLVQIGVTGLLDEERDGTLPRLQAAPIPRWSILVGKGMTSFVLGIIALTVLATATTLLMGADWGHPVGLAALFVAMTLTAMSLLGVVGAVAKTPEGAGNLVAVIAVGLGMLGGTFFPAGSGNRLLELASLATPHSWFMRGIGDLSSEDPAAVLGPIVALLGFTVVFGSLATVLLVRRYRR